MLTVLIVMLVAVYTAAQLRFLIVCAVGALARAKPRAPAGPATTYPVVAIQVAT